MSIAFFCCHVILAEDKVRYMNEIVRLHATCGDQHRCSKYLVAACDILTATMKPQDTAILDEQIHNKVLQACYIDVGYVSNI